MTAPLFILRPPRLEDVPVYTAYLANPDVSLWLDDVAQRPVPAARVEAIMLRDAWCLWSIECEGRFVGVTSLYEPDSERGVARFFITIGDPTLWGKGLGAAVTQEVLVRAFDVLGLRRVASDCLEPNKASLRIHERAGYVEEGRLRKDAWRRGEWVDRILLGILEDEWRARASDGAGSASAEGRGAA